MKWFIGFILAFALASASAQSPQIRRLLLQQQPAAGSAYTGPGDIQSFAWWGGFRAYSAAKAGTKAINLCDDTGANCSDVSTNASTGALNAGGTHGSNNCDVSGTCKVKIIYDQVSTNDISQATLANMPLFTPNAINSSACSTVSTSGSGQWLESSATFSSGAQPYSALIIAKQNGTAGDQGSFALLDNGFANGFSLNFNNGGNIFNVFAGSGSATSVTSSTVMATYQAIINGASGIVWYNATRNTGQNAGTATVLNRTVSWGRNQSGQSFNGVICEAGYTTGSIDTNSSALNTNMHAAYGSW